jgi:hypothetical protein
MRSYPAYWVLHDLLLEPLPQQKSLELCEANEAETTDKCLKQARITHPSLMSTPRAKKELGWRRQAMLHRREATNCHGPLGIVFFCKWLQKPAAQFEPADGNLPGPDYSTDSRIDSSTLILIQAGGHSHNISNCAHVCLFKSCRGML